MTTTNLHLPTGTRLYIKSAEGEEQIVTDKSTTLHVSDMKLHIDDDQEQSPVWDEHPAPTVKSWEISVDAPPRIDTRRYMRRLFEPPKYPRKLKKAIASWWVIENEGELTSVSFHNKRKTKWQRKAQRLIKREDGHIDVPMKNGWMMSIVYRETEPIHGTLGQTLLGKEQQ